eukprot:12339127-Heterocapsa_arctica.AAC.1
MGELSLFGTNNPKGGTPGPTVGHKIARQAGANPAVLNQDVTSEASDKSANAWETWVFFKPSEPPGRLHRSWLRPMPL